MSFNYDSIPIGYYDQVFLKKNGLRKFWHWHKFNTVLRCLKLNSSKSLMDIGCFAGSFIGRFVHDEFPKIHCLGVDILKEQVEYAKNKYSSETVKFLYFSQFKKLHSEIQMQTFDSISCIEVIEHLNSNQIQELLNFIFNHSTSESEIIFTTPNYSSIWPILEFCINLFSDVKYEEQHLTKFNYFRFINKIQKIYPNFNSHFELDLLTTSHFFTPFISIFSFSLAQILSKSVQPIKWKNPFGAILIIKLKPIKEACI